MLPTSYAPHLRTALQIPSDKIEFNKAPDMKAREITAAGIEALKSGKYKVVRINYANPDMVGHTGEGAGQRADRKKHSTPHSQQSSMAHMSAKRLAVGPVILYYVGSCRYPQQGSTLPVFPRPPCLAGA